MRRRRRSSSSRRSSHEEPHLVADGESWSPSAQQSQPGSPETGEDAADEEDNGSGAYEVMGPAWKGRVIALVPVVVILFGAGRGSWRAGLAAVLVALVMLIFPVQRRLPTLAAVSLLGAIFAPLLAFLPAGFTGPMPNWWHRLQDDWGIQLSSTLTPQASVTWEAWLTFALSLLWLGWCLTRGFSTEQRRGMLQVLAIGGSVLSLLSVMDYMGWVPVQWWPSHSGKAGISFGPFTNRNHTSSMAAISCLLAVAAAYDAFRHQARTWLLYLLATIPPVVCILSNTSRAGVLLLFLGLTTWFGTVAMRKGYFQKMAMVVTFVCLVAAAIVMSEGGLSTRLKKGEIALNDGRVAIQWSALQMAMQAPWVGVGLGNFSPVFPLAMDELQQQRPDAAKPRNDAFYRYLHPESDLLWLLTEGGLLTVLPSCVLVFWIYRSTGPWFNRKRRRSSGRLDRRLRNAVAIAFGMGALHGLVDVPNHGLGFAILMGLLAGMCLRPRRLPLASTLLQRLTFRSVGVGVLLLGIGWLGVALGHLTLPGYSAADMLRARANELTDSNSVADALPLMNQAVRMAPLNFQYYHERATMRLRGGSDRDDALLDFSRSRMVEPHHALLCYREGVTWLSYYPPYAIIGWREFLKRFPEAAPGQYGYYRQMLNHSARFPALRESLWSLATSPALKMDYLSTVSSREEFERCLQSLMSQPNRLDGLDSSQMEALFSLWSRLGDEKALIAGLEKNKKWLADGWRLLASYYARESEFRQACLVAAAFLPSVNRSSASSFGTDMASLERGLLYNPTDARIGLDLFQAQKNAGQIDGAIRTLEKMLQQPNAPAYTRQELAALYVAKGDYRRAWENYAQAMQVR